MAGGRDGTTLLAPSPGCAGVAGLRRRLGRTTMPQ
jgi:hypothetical protein